METIKGFEVSGSIYENEDETARVNSQTNTNKIGNLSDLQTKDKTSLVNALNEIINSLPGGGIDVTSIWVASAKYGFNDTNFAYKVLKQANPGGTYTYTISALAPFFIMSTAYIRFDKLPRSVFGITAEGQAQTSSGIVIEATSSFANTRNSEGASGVTVAIGFYQSYLRLEFGSYSSDRSNQGLCTWKLMVAEDLDHYFTD